MLASKAVKAIAIKAEIDTRRKGRKQYGYAEEYRRWAEAARDVPRAENREGQAKLDMSLKLGR